MAFAVAVLALVAILSVQASGASDVPMLEQLASSQFTGFMKLVELADLMPQLEAALASPRGLTIFAPTDDALLYHTSPTLLAFLKRPENQASLRHLLLSHLVPERLSPFVWEGSHPTLSGSSIALSMDSQAFYASRLAVMQYNSLVSKDATIHSLPTLILPADLTVDGSLLDHQVFDSRRVLAQAPSPSPVSGPTDGPLLNENPNPNGAAARALVSALSLVVAAVAAVLLC